MSQNQLISRWYALYTKSRCEKKVAEQLVKMNITHYLPLQKTLKQWSDRKKYVQEVVLKGYIFVYVSDNMHHNILQANGVVCFVTSEGKKATIPEKQILALKEFVNKDFRESYENFENGDYVEIALGQFKGLKGTIIKKRGKHKVILQIEAINQHIELSIPQSLLKKISPDC